MVAKLNTLSDKRSVYESIYYSVLLSSRPPRDDGTSSHPVHPGMVGHPGGADIWGWGMRPARLPRAVLTNRLLKIVTDLCQCMEKLLETSSLPI